jgi:hypothetical protein
MSNGRKAIPPGAPWGKANGCSAMTSLVRRRVVLSFSRDLEFATETELAKRMGCQKHYWLRATLKELIDNARYIRRRAHKK